MRRLIQTTALCLALATPVSADIIYEGRDAQGLHCAAMLAVASAVLYKAGRITDSESKKGMIGVGIIMSELPGSKNDKKQAMRQRVDKIVATRSIDQLAKEFKSTGKWCIREFLR